MPTQSPKTRSVIPAYRKLGRRLDAFPQGAPPTRLLFDILEILFSPEEAEQVSCLPLMPFDADKAAGIWKVNGPEARRRLDHLAQKGLLLDIVTREDRRIYVLPPPMAGFFEFSLMRTRHDIDQKTLAALYYQYINVEEDFARALFLSGGTQLGRVFVQEPALPEDCSFQILDHERASEVILTSASIAVGLCYCRNKMAHIGRACDAPKSICMTFNEPAASLVRNGFARRVDAVEGMELLHQAYEHNLVQGGENVRRNVSFICHCCGCCCEGLIAARKFGFDHPIETSNFMATLQPDLCRGCGKCVAACPVAALHPSEKNGAGEHAVRLEEALCLGCGVCVRSCPHGALTLKPRASRVITPVDMVYRMVLMAVERGVLQNLIFDNQALLSHRVMARLLGSILKLPPVKQALANRQLQSRYIDALIAWKGEIFEHTGWAQTAEKTHAFAELEN